MQPEYKTIKIAAPHCPVCKSKLLGDNSIAFPWKCDCGVWKNSISDPFNYEVEPERKNAE